MAVYQLASQEDVEAVLGRVLTSAEAARVDAVLDKLSELFRRESGQQFTPGSSTVRLKVNAGRVYLPQTPLDEIVSVVDDDAVAVEFTAAGSWLTTGLASHQFVTVEYSHGGIVPDLVRLAVADAARQVLTVDSYAATGVSQRGVTTGPFSDQFTYAAWAQGGSSRLSPDDVALARSYRVKVPTVWVQSP